MRISWRPSDRELPRARLATFLKLGVLSTIAGLLPEPPAELSDKIRELRKLV